MTTVRPYESADERQFRGIALQNYAEQLPDGRSPGPDDPAARAYLEHIMQIHESGKGVILIAERRVGLIGFVCLLWPDGTAVDNRGEGAYAFMSDLFIVPQYRNEGVGSLLTQALERQAREMGASHVALRVAADNTGSRRFYKETGYQEKFVVMSKGFSDRD
jgi:ribosomal protein S18 acetylase RimI-like enzyme